MSNQTSNRQLRRLAAVAVATAVVGGLPSAALAGPASTPDSAAPVVRFGDDPDTQPDGADPDQPAPPGTDDPDGPSPDPDPPATDPVTNPQEKARAGAVVGLPADGETLALNDRDFTWAVWKKAKPGSEVRAEAELAMDGYDPGTRLCGACADFIRFKIYDANTRDINNQKVAETLARVSRERRQNAARKIGMSLGDTPEQQATALAQGDRDFLYGVHKFLRDTKPRFTLARAEALKAAEGSAEDMVRFLSTGLEAAYDKDQHRVIEEDNASDAAAKERALRWASRTSACVAVVVSCQPAWEQIADDDFIRQLRRSMDRETFVIVLDRSETLLADGDAAAWRAFIDKGIHEAKKADIERLDKLTFEHWRGVVTKVRDDAERDGLKNRARAATKVLATAKKLGELKAFYATYQTIGEGDSDAALFYDYGKSTVTMWTLNGLGQRAGTAKKVWTSPASWTFKAMSSVSGDFTGDGKRDVAVMYRLKDKAFRLYVFEDVDSRATKPRKVWETVPKVIGPAVIGYQVGAAMTGDFNGDGRADVGAFASTPGGKPVFMTFASGADGAFTVAEHPTTEPMLGATPVVGDFTGDKKADVAALTFDKDHAKLWLMASGGTGLAAPKQVWSGPAKDWSRATVMQALAGDVDRDGTAELAVLRKDGDGKTSVWVVDDVAKTPSMTRRWASETWSANLTKAMVADVNGDGRDDLVALYRYGDREMKAWVLRAEATGFAPARQAYGSPTWSWDKTAVTR